MARPGHPVLNWNQLKKAQAVFMFFRTHWKEALVTELYPTSCTVIYQDNGRDYTTRIVDLENIRSIRKPDSEHRTESTSSKDDRRSGDDLQGEASDGKSI